MSAVHATPIYPETATNAANATAAHFDIVITVQNDANGKPEYCVPRNIPNVMRPGDTVTYVSPNGLVEIDFDPDSTTPPPAEVRKSPYVDATGKDLPTVQGGILLHVKNVGTYFGKCSLTDMITKKKLVWAKSAPGSVDAKESDQSGGNHVVK